MHSGLGDEVLASVQLSKNVCTIGHFSRSVESSEAKTLTVAKEENKNAKESVFVCSRKTLTLRTVN